MSNEKRLCKSGHDISTSDRKTSSGSCKACIKEKSLLQTYGITLDEYEQIWKAQDGKCAVCGRKLRKLFEDNQALGRVEVDHKHGTNLPKRRTVRGLLCGGRWAGCNRRIGRIDNIEWLRKVINYLENPPAKSILESVSEKQRKLY